MTFYSLQYSLINVKGKKLTTLILAIGLGLFISCKSSLLDLCPSFVKEVPSCHQHSSSQKTSTDCECPLLYTELKLEDHNFISISPSPSLESYFGEYLPKFIFSSFKYKSLHSAYGLRNTPTFYFLETIRLTIWSLHPFFVSFKSFYI